MSGITSNTSPLALGAHAKAASPGARKPRRPADVPNLLYGIAEVGKATSLGRSSVYSLIAAGKLRTVKVGRRTLIRAEDLKAFVDGLGAEA
jgi:excisionase family DNA binding protein